MSLDIFSADNGVYTVIAPFFRTRYKFGYIYMRLWACEGSEFQIPAECLVTYFPRKLGYILKVHPSFARIINECACVSLCVCVLTEMAEYQAIK